MSDFSVRHITILMRTVSGDDVLNYILPGASSADVCDAALHKKIITSGVTLLNLNHIHSFDFLFLLQVVFSFHVLVSSWVFFYFRLLYSSTKIDLLRWTNKHIIIKNKISIVLIRTKKKKRMKRRKQGHLIRTSFSSYEFSLFLFCCLIKWN